MIRLETLHGRTPALAALGVVCVVVLLLIALPAYGLFEAQSEERTAELQRLAFYHAEMDARPALLSELADLQAKVRMAPGLIRAQSADLAAAQIQSDLKELITANAGEIRSAQTAPVIRQQGFETISVAYELNVPLSHLRALIYAIEAHTPYLVLNDIAISAPQTGATQVADPVLEVRCTVHGYRWAART